MIRIITISLKAILVLCTATLALADSATVEELIAKVKEAAE